MLNFSSPNLFMPSLQKAVNNHFRDNRLPLNFKLHLRNDHNQIIDNQDYWDDGQHEIRITFDNSQKTVAKIYSYNINNQNWFRYWINSSKKLKSKDLNLLASTLREVLIDANLDGSDTNIAQVNTELKIKKYEDPITVNGEWLFIPLVAGYLTFLVTHLSLFGPMMTFLLPILFITAITYSPD
jgi:hypothetical protein